MKINLIAALLAATCILAPSAGFAADALKVVETPMFYYDLGVLTHRAALVRHDNIWSVATNVPNGKGTVYMNYVDQWAIAGHGGVNVVVGDPCVGGSPETRFYSNGDGTYDTITKFSGCADN